MIFSLVSVPTLIFGFTSHILLERILIDLASESVPTLLFGFISLILRGRILIDFLSRFSSNVNIWFYISYPSRKDFNRFSFGIVSNVNIWIHISYPSRKDCIGFSFSFQFVPTLIFGFIFHILLERILIDLALTWKKKIPVNILAGMIWIIVSGSSSTTNMYIGANI